MVGVRSAVFNIAFYINLIVLMILGLPIMMFGYHGVLFMARLWGSTSVWLLEKICNLKVEYRGLENIPKQGYILAAKHQSFLETFALLAQTPEFAIILKRQLVYIPLFGLYLIVGKQISIDRAKGQSALAQIIRQAKPMIAAGRTVYIYPEGTRRPSGARPAYKFGVTALYSETGAPCIPVALNTGLFWGRRGFTRRPGVAVIEFLPAIAPGLSREDFASKLETMIESACDRLNEEACRAHPPLADLLRRGTATTA